MRLLLATLALLFGLTSANAQIAGQNDPQFKAALELWLEGEEDLVALTALSELAKADNRAAQVFLGRVNEATHTHIHVTGQMERKARIALMRQVGGLSGKSWLKAASEDVPLAVAFLQSKVIREKPAAIEALLDMGEVMAALIAMQHLQNAGEYDFVDQLSQHSDLPDHVSYLRSISVFNLAARKAYAIYEDPSTALQKLEAQTDKMTTDGARFLWNGYKRRHHYIGIEENRIGDPIEFPPDMVDNVYYAPLHTFCSKRCSDNIPHCMRSLIIQQTYANTPIWIALASPVENLLPTSDYNNSPRISNDIIRLMKASPPGAKGMKRYDQCAYQAVFAE